MWTRQGGELSMRPRLASHRMIPIESRNLPPRSDAGLRWGCGGRAASRSTFCIINFSPAVIFFVILSALQNKKEGLKKWSGP